MSARTSPPGVTPSPRMPLDRTERVLFAVAAALAVLVGASLILGLQGVESGVSCEHARGAEPVCTEFGPPAWARLPLVAAGPALVVAGVVGGVLVARA